MKKGMKVMKGKMKVRSGKGKTAHATKPKSRVVKSASGSSSDSSSDSSDSKSGSADERLTRLSQRTVAGVGEMSLEDKMAAFREKHSTDDEVKEKALQDEFSPADIKRLYGRLQTALSRQNSSVRSTSEAAIKTGNAHQSRTGVQKRLMAWIMDPGMGQMYQTMVRCIVQAKSVGKSGRWVTRGRLENLIGREEVIRTITTTPTSTTPTATTATTPTTTGERAHRQ